MRILAIIVIFLVGVSHAQNTEDRSVRWGYKLIYDPKLKSEEIKNLRKQLKAKEVAVLYPPEKNWNLPSGFLGVSSYLQENEIKALSSSILKVESAEKTHLLKVTLRGGLNVKETKKVLALFPAYKIQVLSSEELDQSVRATLKTTLTANQLKGISEFGSILESIEE